MEPVELAELLRNALDAPSRPRDAPIRLRQIGRADGRTLSDVSQLQRLLINLCLNAIQAMEGNGGLTVR
jgi:signal transduction histidine kinase